MNELVIENENTKITLTNVSEIYKKGEWIRFYGYYKNDIIYVEYVESLIGVDINILKRLIKKIYS